MNKENQLAQKLGDRRNQYLSLSNVPIEEVTFAKNSQFYGKIMEDGYIFNPYIHRRWLPAQFIRVFKDCKTQAERKQHYLDRGERKMKEYFANFLFSEMRKLAMLKGLDPDAYQERSKFFTVDICREFFEGILESILGHLSVRSYVNRQEVYIKWIGWTPLQETENVIDGKIMIVKAPVRYETHVSEALQKLTYAKSYKKILDICLDGSIFYEGAAFAIYPKYDLFPAFDKAGLYYTIKHYLMFEDALYKGKSGAEGLDLLRSELDSNYFNIEEAEKELEKILGE